ncbi:hypothetical protein X801_09844, partial [Opisthorchis viverrini]
CILGATLLAVFIFCTLWLYRVTRPAKNQEESFQMNQTMNGAHTVDDSKLATSAQRYHFEYQKRQMLSRTLKLLPVFTVPGCLEYVSKEQKMKVKPPFVQKQAFKAAATKS